MPFATSGLSASPDDLRFDTDTWGGFPVVAAPRRLGAPLVATLEKHTADLIARVDRHGAVLFRDFRVEGLQEFRAFAAAFGDPLLSYDFASTPRTALGNGVYTSTEYPAHQEIPLHNEQSYATSWPMKIWFYCAKAALRGGETPIADSRIIHRRIDPRLRAEMTSRRLMYVRNFGGGLDLPWSVVFGTSDRVEVERRCRSQGIVCEWKGDGELRTRQVCQAVVAHPRSTEMVWFNQAHLFHVSNLETDVREALLSAVEIEDLPRNVYYGDGAPLEVSALDEIRGVLAETSVAFAWQEGDVLMLDNMLAAHGRRPFVGSRQVVVAMAGHHAGRVSA